MPDLQFLIDCIKPIELAIKLNLVLVFPTIFHIGLVIAGEGDCPRYKPKLTIDIASASEIRLKGITKGAGRVRVIFITVLLVPGNALPIPPGAGEVTAPDIMLGNDVGSIATFDNFFRTLFLYR